MRLFIRGAAWLAARLLLPAVVAQDSSPGGAVHDGQPEDCTGWHTVVSGDNCQNVPERYGITLEQFLEWNPAVSSDCLTNFWLESAYCVRVGNTPDPTPGGPVHDGQPDNCNGWHTVVSGDNCQNVPERYGITFEQFLEWNPALSSDCLTNFWLESAYCVSIGESSPSPTTSTSSITTSKATITSVPGTPTTSYNSTYSTRHPVTSWNITVTTTDGTWPPTRTLAGQTDICNAWHRVSPGDSCERLLSKYGFQSVEVFLKWNPAVAEDCDMLIAEYWVCIGVQRQVGNTDLEWETAQPEFTEPPEPTSHTSVTPSPADASFTPSPSHGPMHSNCKVFHQATADQNCNDLVSMYGYFSQQQFLEWNPALDGNCLGLWLNTWYCVGAFSDDELPLPAHQMTKPTAGTIPLGHPSDCTRWYQTTGDESCALIALMFGSFDEADFVAWNPSVFSDCSGIIPEAWYCVGRPGTPTTRTEGAPAPTQDVPSTRPTQSGIAAGCTDFWLVSAEDTCSSIARQAGISLDNLYSWNAAITAGSCAGLEADYYVCVGVGGQGTTGVETTPTQTATSTSAPPPTTTTAAPGPVQTPSPVREGMTGDCVRFYLQQPGDLCWVMASGAGISLDQFYEWNPAVGTECENLWPDYYYCIGVSGPATTITQGPPVPT